MRCLSPRTVGFNDDGKTISWSQKHYSKEFATFQLPCGKCIECRLEYARQWAVRCVHEAKMYNENSFITLTYSDESLATQKFPDKLYYEHFQTFLKDLRDKIFRDTITESFGKGYWSSLSKSEKKQFRKENKDLLEKHSIGFFVTGEYGELRKRPHWHAIIFNWRPTDCVYKYSNERGDKVYSSATLDALWSRGITEVGSVTFESAGYCARYAAKKLVHGADHEHDFQPISKKSSKNAIGKKFLEKFWQDIFNYGHVVLDNGTKSTIPRYYEKWLQKNHPEHWVDYVTKTKSQRMRKAEEKKEKEQIEQNLVNDKRAISKGHQISRSTVRKTIIDKKFKILQKHLKGDI